MAYLYPWGNTQELNLDWILQKIKDIDAGSGNADLNEVANALIAATYARKEYARNDIVYYDGKLYRANRNIPAPGEVWTPAHWDEILIGDTLSNVVQYLAALANDQVINNSNVTGYYTSDALNTLLGIFSNYFYLGADDLTVIDQGTDYNTLTTAGVYKCAGSADAATMINSPSTAYAHKLIVIYGNNNTVITQLAVINYQTVGLLARSRRNNGTWGDWHYLTPIRITDTVAAGTTGQTFSHTSVIASAVVLSATFSNPKAVGSDVTFSTAAGQITITGTFYDALDITYYLQ